MLVAEQQPGMQQAAQRPSNVGRKAPNQPPMQAQAVSMALGPEQKPLAVKQISSMQNTGINGGAQAKVQQAQAPAPQMNSLPGGGGFVSMAAPGGQAQGPIMNGLPAPQPKAAPAPLPAPATNFGSQYYQPGQVQRTDLATYQPGQLGNDPMATYQAGQINQYQNQDLGGVQGQVQQALQGLLGGGSLGPQQQAAMESRLRDQAAVMQKSGNADIAQRFAGRGGAGAAQAAALQASLGESTQSNLLNNFRDLGIQAAQINRGDMERAVGLGEQAMSGQVNRATQQFGAGLQGQTAQEGLNQAAVNSQQNAQQFDLQRRMQQEALNQAGINSQNQNTQWGHQQFMDNEGLRQAQANFGMQGRQGDITMRGQTLQDQQFGRDLDFRKVQHKDSISESRANRSASSGSASASRAQQQAQWEAEMAWQQQQALMRALGF